MQGLGTSDYMGSAHWRSATNQEPDPDDAYPFVSQLQPLWYGDFAGDFHVADREYRTPHRQPLVLKKRGNSISSGMASGQTTPGGGPNGTTTAGRQKTLSEGDLARADEALRSANGRP